eukprot:11531776-Heterocapsa_arctica.AAC.1
MWFLPSQVIKNCTRIWQPVAHAGPQGCLCFGHSQLALPQHGLQDVESPVLTLLEALNKAGWRRGRENTPHLKDDAEAVRLLFYIQNCTRRRLYFHCLLRLDELFEKGLPALPCNEVQLYYKCLLMGLATGTLPAILPGRPAKEYKALLSSCSAAPHDHHLGGDLLALEDDESDDIVQAVA